MHVKIFALLTLAVVIAQGKPSHPFGFHGVPDHFDLVPPVLPPVHFHANDPAALVPYHQHTPILPPVPFHTAPLLPAPAPLLPAPAALLPAPLHLPTAPAPLLPAPAPLLPAPVHLLPAPVAPTPVITPVVNPVLEAIPFVEPIPSYRAIPGPKTTTHHLSVGYAFPHGRLSKLHGHVHALPHTAPWPLAHHHHHHTLF